MNQLSLKATLTVWMAAGIAFVSVISGCSKDEPTDTNWTLQLTKLKNAYFETGSQLLGDAQVSVQVLESKIDGYAGFAGFANYQVSRGLWQDAFRKFQLLGVFRANPGTDLSNPFQSLDSRLDLPCLNPAYIDYTAANPSTGIIQNPGTYPTINPYNVSSWNQAGNQGNVTLGFHAVEFLIWGEDPGPSSAGARTYTDYQNTHPDYLRRGYFISGSIENLRIDLNLVKFDAAYQTKIKELEPRKVLKMMLESLRAYIRYDFAEDAIKKVYDSQNTMDELSPYSDNTITDLYTRLDAIELFLTGSNYFGYSSGYFLDDFIKERDEASARGITDQLAVIRSDIDAINGPFETAVSSPSERPKLLQLYNDLVALDGLFGDFSALMNL